MTPPTIDAARIETISKYPFAENGYSGDDIDRLIAVVNSYFVFVTGRVYDDSLPVSMWPLWEQLVVWKIEAFAVQGTPAVIETAGDFSLLASMTAGSYTETRRAMDDWKKVIDADPRVNAAVWGVLTPEKHDYWMGVISGVQPPAYEITGFPYSSPAFATRWVDDSYAAPGITYDSYWEYPWGY